MSNKKFNVQLRMKSHLMGDEQVIKSINIIKSAIDKIYMEEASSLSFEELYRNSYTLSINKHGRRLYKDISESIKRNITPYISMLIDETSKEEFLRTFITLFDKHDTALKMVRDINMYLDRNFVVKEKQKDIYTMGHIMFKKFILRDNDVHTRFINFILERINEERNGEKIERDFIRGAIKILIELGFGNNNVYKKDFEKIFLEKSNDFYINEAQQCIATHSAYEYLKIVQRRLEEEDERCLDYLIDETRKPLIKKVLTPMIENHAKALIMKTDSGLGVMIRLKQYSIINLMYRIFDQVPTARKLFENFLVETVNEDCQRITSDESINQSPITFIEKCIDAKQKYNSIIQQSCNKDNDLALSIKRAFEECLSKFENSALYLSKYIDTKLKKDIRILKDDEINNMFDKVIEIFRLLPDKDEFEGYYRNGLTKRLLNATCSNDEAERLMISKLKIECGCIYTSKFETMMKDMNLSEELNKQFKSSRISRDIDYEFNIKVLTTGNWSNDATGDHCKIPLSLQYAADKFTEFYMSKHSGRILSWKMNFGNADLIGNFGDRSYECSMTGYQMLVLLLFNDNTKLSVTQIKTLTGIDSDYELKRNVLSLVKTKILLKNTKEFDLTDTDILMINDNFKSKLLRLKIPLLSQKDQLIVEKKTVIVGVHEDRRHLIEASIVRVMKARKKMEHNELISETMKILVSIFQPTSVMIKQRIEGLIEKDYIIRDPDDRKVYIYKA